ncbi:MAG: hypothetical protein QM343_04890 [Bacillota bacterium]|nr:hypothetical protein [Bacillota bacterium]
MEIIITQHAIEQHRHRTFGANVSDDEIKKLLTKAVKHGKKEVRRPPFNGNIFKVTYKDFSVVVDYRGGEAIVLTYLGTKEYQNWYHRNEIRPRALCCY